MRTLLTSALYVSLAAICYAGLGNDNSWFNGSLPAAPPTPSSSGGSYGGGGYSRAWSPPPPTREELDLKDLAESSDDFVDKGNKFYKKGDWATAIAFYKRALKENPENDDAIRNLKKAQQLLVTEQARLRAEYERNQQALAEAQEKERIETQRRLVEACDKSIQEDRRGHDNQLQKLMVEADHIKVPPPPVWTHVKVGFLLGLFDPQDGVQAKFADATTPGKNVQNPFTGKLFTDDEVKQGVFSSTDTKSANEVLRGFLDNHTIGEYSLNTDFGKRLIARLNGVEFDRLVAHSNGGTIAEALIKKGVIKVNELNVVGGDRSLVNQAGYQNLIDSGAVKRVVVWINPGDTIPAGSSIASLTPWGSVNVAPLITSAEHAANQLAGNHQGGDTKVEYRLLQGPQYAGQTFKLDKTIFDAHDLVRSYLPNIGSYFGSHPTNNGTN